MRKREPSLWPGAIIFVVLFSMGMAHPILNGWQPKQRVKHTAEPAGVWLECWLIPWLSWCRRPADPKELTPDVPAGCCSDLCIGPCA
jgi:hypothetical protein